jgi:predicted phage terminase large subunit-like protein
MDKELSDLLADDFLVFAKKSFYEKKGKRMPRYLYLELLANRLANFALGSGQRMVVNLPPRHFKTWLGSICLPAWILARDPSARILVVSYGQELADEIADAMRAVMQANWYRQAFKHAKLAKRKLANIKTIGGGEVRCVSIEGGITGFGADYIIVDDPVEIKDWDNIRRLERINGLFDNEVFSRLDQPKSGGVLILAHRVNEEDLSGHLLNKGGWKHLKLPFLGTRRRSYALSDGSTWERRKDEPLMPDAYSARELTRLRKVKAPGFDILYQQDAGKERFRIKGEYVLTFSPAAVPWSPSGVVASIDPGQKSGGASSYSVVQFWLPAGKQHFLLHQWRERATYSELRTNVRHLMARYRPSIVLLEDTNLGTALFDEIGSRSGMTVHPILPQGKKSERLRRHLQLIRSGGITVPHDAPWRPDFVFELTHFPYAGQDDQIDAMTQYLDWIAQHPEPPKRERPALGMVTNSRGYTFGPEVVVPETQCRGGVLVRASRLTNPNALPIHCS